MLIPYGSCIINKKSKLSKMQKQNAKKIWPPLIQVPRAVEEDSPKMW